ncbi:substrate-binding domain-containing protein [Ohessyouella blattaphilus]|uniref:Substrate-binding domain-containing protein n=1 Tax=Ohessyouella blattaphilus TaxID=2949333 RepID=A0ABT1EDW2_9FIRM|nr:substrate-binding domain-containing protein [Ohessyouella blattaphilus]MCP1108878.1 substrate-binding domain-containing protein [Ohessyouella blattaphilus]MCR8562272.1 substrate-binding domain-containing protein [Ohessyouella blattaphilus]
MKRRIVVSLLVAAIAAVNLTGCQKSVQAGSDGAEVLSGDITVISREEGSGTRGAFVELIGIEEKIDGEKVDQTTPDAQITNSTSVMMTTVAEDENALGYISLGSLNDTVKAIKVDGAAATEENIKKGTYKVARPFNVVRKEGNKNAVVDDFIDFIYSEDGQALVSDNGYIPTLESVVFESAKPKGKAVIGGSSSVSPLMEKLIEAYQTINPQASLELQTTDSTTGVSSTLDGSYDLGMASREIKAEEINKGAIPLAIATDGIAVIVNKRNSLEDITSTDLRAIYVGEILAWDEIVR